MLVKFLLDLAEFLRKLFPHSLIQLLNDLFQSFLRCDQILILAGQKGVSFQKVPYNPQ